MGFGINPPVTSNTIDAFIAKAKNVTSIPVWTETATAAWTGSGIAGAFPLLLFQTRRPPEAHPTFFFLASSILDRGLAGPRGHGIRWIRISGGVDRARVERSSVGRDEEWGGSACGWSCFRDGALDTDDGAMRRLSDIFFLLNTSVRDTCSRRCDTTALGKSWVRMLDSGNGKGRMEM